MGRSRVAKASSSKLSPALCQVVTLAGLAPCASTLAHIASKMECLQGGDAKMEQEEVKAEAEAEEASPSLPIQLCLCGWNHSARNMVM